MNIRETLFSAVRTLLSHKLRTALTMLGIIIGSSALVAVMSLIAGLNSSVAAQFQSIGTDIISVGKYPWVQMGDQEDYGSRKDITIDLYNLQGVKVRSWQVFRCWVSEFTAVPELDANANAVAFETIVLQNEGFIRDEAVVEVAET